MAILFLLEMWSAVEISNKLLNQTVLIASHIDLAPIIQYRLLVINVASPVKVLGKQQL